MNVDLKNERANDNFVNGLIIGDLRSGKKPKTIHEELASYFVLFIANGRDTEKKGHWH
jgi:hypothetical protein